MSIRSPWYNLFNARVDQNVQIGESRIKSTQSATNSNHFADNPTDFWILAMFIVLKNEHFDISTRHLSPDEHTLIYIRECELSPSFQTNDLVYKNSILYIMIFLQIS